MLSKFEVLKKFEHLENELGLPDDRINGVPWWDKVRYPLYNEIYHKVVFNVGAEHDKTSKKNKAWRCLSSLKKIPSFFRFAVQIFGFFSWYSPVWAKKKGVLVYGHPRRKYEDGVYVDIYTDPFIELMPEECKVSVIERGEGGGHLKPCKTKNLFYSDSFDAMAHVVKLIKRSSRSIATEDVDKIRGYEEKINQSFGIEIDLTSKVCKVVNDWPIDVMIYDCYLRIKKPTHVFFVVSAHHESLVFASRKNNIPAIELQHGSPVRGKMNYDYSSGAKKETFPDWFVSFGDYWTKAAQLPIEKSRIFPLGFPYLDQKYKKKFSRKDQRSLLIISQSNVSSYLCEFAIDCALYFGEEIDVVFKPHPSEYTNGKTSCTASLTRYGIRVARETEDLYELLGKSQVHLGVYSTALYEGIALGGACYVLDVPGSEYMNSLIEDGLAKLISTPAEIEFDKSVSIERREHLFAMSSENKVSELLEITSACQDLSESCISGGM